MVAFHPEYGGRGLATKLYGLSIDIARVNGAGAVTIEAVSHFAYKAAVKNGFTVLNRVRLQELVFRGSKPLAGRDLGINTEGYFLALRL